MRKSDYGKELSHIIAELKANSLEQDKKIEAQAKQIVILYEDNLACMKKSAMQDIEIYKQAGIIAHLEARVKHLEEAAMPAVEAAALLKHTLEKTMKDQEERGAAIPHGST